MKRILVAFCLFALAAPAIAQNTQAAHVATQKKPDEIVKFNQAKHDFGKIQQNKPVTYDFVFENLGAQPVVIETATASCGCTTPTWPKTPVMKNKKDKVTAGFNASAIGPFEKTITVKVAGYDMPLELRITGEVLNAADYAKYEATKTKKSGK